MEVQSSTALAGGIHAKKEQGQSQAPGATALPGRPHQLPPPWHPWIPAHPRCNSERRASSTFVFPASSSQLRRNGSRPHRWPSSFTFALAERAWQLDDTLLLGGLLLLAHHPPHSAVCCVRTQSCGACFFECHGTPYSLFRPVTAPGDACAGLLPPPLVRTENDGYAALFDC